ncbi:hypothetical protein HN51_067275 [Arachis hypogaea]
MKNSIRGCISCILPCGALDVIRIVHSNGRIEELTTLTINIADVMRAHPNHILKKYSPSNLLIVSQSLEMMLLNLSRKQKRESKSSENKDKDNGNKL